MIRRLLAWWRRIDGHWRQKRELLLAAEKALQDLGYVALTYEEIELYLLSLGVLHLESAVYGQLVAHKAMESGIREGFGDAHQRAVH